MCKEEIPADAKKCGKCGAKQGNWVVRHPVWTAIIAIFVLMVIVSAGSNDKATQTSNDTTSQASTSPTDNNEEVESTAVKATPEPKKDRLTLDDGWKLDTSGYLPKITGYVTNNSDRDIDSYVQINFNGYDEEGASIGDCMANANHIDAGGKWKFEATCFKNGITEVKFDKITGF